MKTNVYCLTTDKGIQSFYLEAYGETHYLFSQNFRRGVKEYFGQGVNLDDAMDYSRAKNNYSVVHTMRKLPSYIKYIEKEHDIEVLRSTARKKAHTKKYAA